MLRDAAVECQGPEGQGMEQGLGVCGLLWRGLMLFHVFFSTKAPQLVLICSELLIPGKIIPASPGTIKVDRIPLCVLQEKPFFLNPSLE